jgi:L-seryl-tRNA(Ser) seleniumtransferase
MYAPAVYRQLPAVSAVLSDPRVAALPRGVAVATIRSVLDGLRAQIAAGDLTVVPDVAERVVHEARMLLGGRLKPVLNATGIVLHTNLGRAPWSAEALEAARRVAAGYCDLELDLESGDRGGRLAGVEALLQHLTGAEAALVVNNCAAAVLLALTSLAARREVVVSRGELVEIGGSFRVPDVIASGGARLVEVGTTNRTRIADYEDVIGPNTAVLLSVHPSNFRVVGFVQSVPRSALVALAAARGLRVVEDVGSGSLGGREGEPSVREAVAAGVDLVLFSGDKLLGGPQAGLVVGRRDSVLAMRQHALYRALRVDKVTLAGVEATLALHAADRPTRVDAMIGATPWELAARAEDLAASLRASGVAVNRESDVAYVGGGALPGHELPAEVVVVACPRPDALAAALRHGDPPIVARVVRGALRLDPRTLRDDDLPVVARQVAAALRKEY